MNAVLSCVSGDMFEYVRKLFLESCGNNAGSGVCGGAAEAKNFEMVRRALRECGMCVRIWGCSSLRAFHRNDVNSCGLLGNKSGTLVGDLVWCGEEKHVYVCHYLGDLEQ